LVITDSDFTDFYLIHRLKKMLEIDLVEQLNCIFEIIGVIKNIGASIDQISET